MTQHFGKRIIGDAAAAAAAAHDNLGGHAFGPRVRGTSHATDPAATPPVPSPATPDMPRTTAVARSLHPLAMGGIAVADLADVLDHNPAFFNMVYDAELARPDGPRTAALQVFLRVETSQPDGGRPDVVEDLRLMLGLDTPPVDTPSASAPTTGAQTMETPVSAESALSASALPAAASPTAPRPSPLATEPSRRLGRRESRTATTPSTEGTK